jgi:phosphoglycolate phosphatase-like HAD superfamily hydrolase
MHALRPLTALLSPAPRLVMMDCDGIIFDTNLSKCESFRYALAAWPRDAVERLVAHHMATGGVSRYVKIRRFFEELHPVPEPEAAIAEALERFAFWSEKAYAALAPRPESLVFAERLGGRARVHVVSGSDGDELRRVFARHALTPRFAGVHGSPETKVAHMSRLLAEAGVAARDALFIGDGGGDWAAASELGVPFILLTEMSEWRDGAATVEAACEPPEGSASGAFPGAAVARRWSDILEALPAMA